MFSIEKEQKEYLVLSFIPNPRELIDSFKREELSRFMDSSGNFVLDKLIEYFEEHFQENDFIKSIRSKISSEATKIQEVKVIDVHTLMNRDEAKAFFDKLKTDSFTMIIITPWSIAKLLLETELSKITEKITKMVKSLQDEIKPLNLFSIIVPNFNVKTLQSICQNIAEINASQRIVEFLKGETPHYEELLERDPTYEQLRELPEFEKELEKIILDAIRKVQEKIENYATSLAIGKIKEYASNICSIYNLSLIHI